jgi:DNA repair protein RadC
LIGAYRLSKGGISGTVADLKQIFAVGLKLACSDIILSHNHASGSLIPSTNDRLLTDKVCNAEKILEIKTLDHIIISDDGYFSFADEVMLL